MTKDDHIKYWLKTSEEDWKRVNLLLKSKDQVFALFCLHLSIEKLAKALWVKTHDQNIPPKVHNIRLLLSKTPLVLDEGKIEFLDQLNVFQIEGRYPDYQGKIRKAATTELVNEMLAKAKHLKKCIQEKLV